jgi:VWFA-related protein
MPVLSFKPLIASQCAIVLAILATGQTQGASAEQPAQQKSLPQSSRKSATIIRAESRLVVLDVVVSGRNRHLVTGLSKSDFTVLEDGKPQPIVSFEAHVSRPATAGLAQVPQPERQYTNISEQTPSSINIVLFDVLNTPFIDQPYAREQMVQFLKTLPPGQPVSLFELGTRLRMIAGFTTTSDELVAAARKMVPHPSELLDTHEERLQTEEQLGLMREGSLNQGFFDRMQEFMARSWEGRDTNRASATVQALSELAHAVSGFRGRKNVIWLSEEFPVYFGPDLSTDGSRPNPDLRTYSEIMRDAAGVLSAAQISLYPIDVRGLISGQVNAGIGGSRPPGMGQIRQIETLHIAMDDLAKETGGHAYYNTNDLELAMQRSLESGSTYYTLAYVPRAKVGDPRYHRIKVELSRPGLEAEYRKGYFATPEKQHSEEDAAADLFNAVQLSNPQFTMLPLKAQVLPPDPDHSNVRIDCRVDGSGVLFSDGPGDRKNARLRFITMAWDGKFKAAVNISHNIDLSLPPEKYEQAVHNGIAVHQELHLQAGAYRLRLGVMDDGSGKIGTLDIPLRLP